MLLQPAQTEVRINGLAESRGRLESLETALGGAPRAWFSAGLGRGPPAPQDVRLEDMAARLLPGSLVTAILVGGGTLPPEASGNLVLFEGRITRIEMNLDSQDEALRFEAEDLAAEVLQRRVGGQRIRTTASVPEVVKGMSLVFNPDGRPNASTETYEPSGGQPHTIFKPAGATAAIDWTLDKAVAYLLAEFAVSDALTLPTGEDVTEAVGALVVHDVPLEGRTLGEALTALLQLADAQATIVAEPGESGLTRRLEIWNRTQTTATWLVHQLVGATFSPETTNLAAVAATLHVDLAPRRYVARGDRKVYESTFNLVAGWADSSATTDPDDFAPSTNLNFAAVRDVFRKWVLNESGEYSASPYNRGSAPDLSTLFEAEPYARRRRRFLNCLSRDTLGRSADVYAEVSLDAGTSWERLTMTARVLADECGLYLTDDGLPPRYLAAAMRSQVRVRVTAAIESDSCLEAEHGDDGNEGLPGRTRRISVPAGYGYRKVAATSRFHGSPADEADDTERLQDLVDAAFEADLRAPAPTRVDVPWLAMGYRVGQRIQGVSGRRLELARAGAGYAFDPVVRRVRLIFAPAPRTELDLE